jgi:hypothetical protein
VAYLTHTRNKRLQELSAINVASVYNQVYHLQKPDYSRDVTEASSKAYVLVLLPSSHGTNGESRIMIDIWRELAQRFGDVKFCQMRADLCIEGYPEKNTPTVLIYRDGDIKKQLVTLRELRGTQTKAQGTSLHRSEIPAIILDWPYASYMCTIYTYSNTHSRYVRPLLTLRFVTDVEQLLVDIGAVRIGDTRLRRNKANTDADQSTSKIRRDESAVDPDDSDWD